MKNAIWLFVITAVTFLLFLPSFSKMQDVRSKNLDYDQKLVDLKKKQQALIEEKRLLEHDPVYLEKVGREKMGLVKKGEVVFRINSENKPSKEDQE